MGHSFTCWFRGKDYGHHTAPAGGSELKKQTKTLKPHTTVRMRRHVMSREFCDFVQTTDADYRRDIPTADRMTDDDIKFCTHIRVKKLHYYPKGGTISHFLSGTQSPHPPRLRLRFFINIYVTLVCCRSYFFHSRLFLTMHER